MLTIVWDVDDVLNDLMFQWFALGWKREHTEATVEYGGLRENPPHAALGATREEYLASMDAFRKTDAGIRLTPNAEVLEWFAAHGSKFRHVALTARPLETAPEVAAWVMRYFGAWIRCFGIIPTRTMEGVPIYDGGKGEYLRWLGKGDVLVDDTRENLEQGAEIGMQTFAWPQPWNDSQLTTTQILQVLTDMATNLD
jgi:FMN phosphatase YigB (HAD superfamily)